jgi:hypothetical protein
LPELKIFNSIGHMRADELLRLAQTYSQALDIALSTAGTRACGNARIFTRLAQGKGCNSRNLERAAEWFSKNWPHTLEWPTAVPRPERAESKEST